MDEGEERKKGEGKEGGGGEGKEKEKKGKNLDGSRIILAYLTLLPPYFLPFRSSLPKSLFLILILALRIFDLGLH